MLALISILILISNCFLKTAIPNTKHSKPKKTMEN